MVRTAVNPEAKNTLDAVPQATDPEGGSDHLDVAPSSQDLDAPMRRRVRRAGKRSVHVTADNLDGAMSRWRPTVRAAMLVSLACIIAVTCLGGWLGWGAYQAHQDEIRRSMFLEAGRQAAINLTTISYRSIDDNIRRILDSSIGPFHDDFQKRAQPFIDVVKQRQSSSEGTVTESGLESVDRDQAQVLVAVAVKTASAAGGEEAKAWRMRFTVDAQAGGAKVSNVQFVP